MVHVRCVVILGGVETCGTCEVCGVSIFTYLHSCEHEVILFTHSRWFSLSSSTLLLSLCMKEC